MRTRTWLAVLLAFATVCPRASWVRAADLLPPGHIMLSLDQERWYCITSSHTAPLTFYCLLTAPQIPAESISFRLEFSPGSYFLGAELAPDIVDLDPSALGFHLVRAAGCEGKAWPMRLMTATALFFGGGMIRLFGPEPPLVFPSRPSYRPCSDNIDLPLMLGDFPCEEPFPHYPRGSLIVGGDCPPPIDRSSGAHLVEVGLTAVLPDMTASVPLLWGGPVGWSEVDEWCIPLPPVASLTFTARWDPLTADAEWIQASPAIGGWSVQQNLTEGGTQLTLEHGDRPLVEPNRQQLLRLGLHPRAARGVVGVVTTIQDVREAHGEMCNVFQGDGQLRVGCQLRDVRADGQIDVGDAVLAHRIWRGALTPLFEHLCAADLDGNLAVQQADVVALLDAAAESDGASPAALAAVGPVSPERAVQTATVHVGPVHGLILRIQLDPSRQRLVGVTADTGLLRVGAAYNGVTRAVLSDAVAAPRTLAFSVDSAEGSALPRVIGLTGYDQEGAATSPSLEVEGAAVAAPALPAPGESSLLPAAPNPFNPRTTLRFFLAQPSDAMMTIFNAAGREVRRYVCPQMDAGWHELQWDGRDAQGRRLASGVYLLRFESAGVVLGNQKAVLLE